MTTVLPARGRFITFEGGEGAGKSTQARLLVARLQAAGFAAMATREPGGSPGAEAIRRILLSGAVAELGAAGEALLFSAARIDHLERTIRPALAAGTFIVCDRFADSTRAYQGARGALAADFILALENLVVGDTHPDLTLIVDLPVETGLARAADRRDPDDPPDRFEREAIAFHHAVRAGFHAIAAAEPRRCALIDGTRTVGAVADEVWEIVTSRLLAGEGDA